MPTLREGIPARGYLRLGWSEGERKVSPWEGVAQQTPSAFATANCLVEKGQTPCLCSLTPQARLRKNIRKVTRTTEAGFILHPVTLQRKRTSSTFLPMGQKQKPRRASGEMRSLGGRAAGRVHPVGFSRLGTHGRSGFPSGVGQGAWLSESSPEALTRRL